MRKTLKMIALSAAVLLTASIGIGAIGAAAESDDPSLKYVKQAAPAEDSTISLWFEPSFKKVFTSDTTPSGKDTYSVYMAKNEIESAQFVLYSDTEKTKMTAKVTDFTNDNGDTIPAELYYEMYVTTDKLDTTAVLGSDANTTFIREGETPDPVIPLSKMRNFQLNAGKSQAFLIKLRSSESTPSGWYSAQLDISDGDGNIVKTAKVFAYVWDFVIPEKLDLQTSFYLSNDTAYTGTYKEFYDYMLENRLNAMDIPGTLDSSNPYLTNDRVNSIRVAYNGGGNANLYMDRVPSLYSNYTKIYDDMYNSGMWEKIKDKFYFYTADEPMAKEQQYAIGKPDQHTVDDVKARSELLSKYWPDAQTVVPYHENHPYPYYTMHAPMSTFSTADKKDATQEMMETGSVTVWCPQIYAFTPQSELKAINYNGGFNATDKIRDLSGTISGIYSTTAEETVGNETGQYRSEYYNWADIYGQFDSRVKSHIYNQNAAGENYKLWTYSAGWNKGYTYCNHLIENTGLQTKMLFWQLYQNDITGYLYYGSNNWTEADKENNNFTDKTVTGSVTRAKWKTCPHYYPTGYSIFGGGVLFYGGTQSSVRGLTGVVGSLRVEIMRDGIEEYQMFKMLEELRGNDAAKAIVAKVSNNVVDYLSMPKYNAADKADGMDDYDYMESVRRELGNAVEAATADAKCEHEWGDGTVTLEATCTVMGEKHFTCTKCGAEKTEIIPTLHSVGDTFTVVSGNTATCTAEGRQVMRCEICGYEKTVVTKAFHDDSTHYVYKELNDSNHEIYCDVCDTMLEREAHSFNTVYTNTCTEAGEKQSVCRRCGYTKVVEENIAPKGHNLKETTVQPTCTEDGYTLSYCTRCDFEERTVIEKTGHKFEDGFCTVCGEKDPSYVTVKTEDINGDGYVDSDDAIALLNLTLMPNFDAGTEERDLDFNRDGTVDSDDAVYLLYHILLPNLYPLYKG